MRTEGVDTQRPDTEARPLSQWLFAALDAAMLPTVLLETRHVRAAFKTMSMKTDRKDARGIAQLMRLGWFRPVHCKSVSAQETRALLTARKLLQRVFGIALGYADLVDKDDLRRDPALGAALGRIEARRPGLAPLAGKSTLNRLEHAPDSHTPM